MRDDGRRSRVVEMRKRKVERRGKYIVSRTIEVCKVAETIADQ